MRSPCRISSGYSAGGLSSRTRTRRKSGGRGPWRRECANRRGIEVRGYLGDGVKPNRWWYTDDHPHADEYDKETPSGWEETGTMYDGYSGTKRRHMGRQIGFLSGDVTMP